MWWRTASTSSAPSLSTAEPRVADHRTKPPGVVPPHLQQWVLTGLVAVMVGILALFGPPQRPRPFTASSLPPPAVDANQQRIQEYQRRIQEEVDRLSAERARFELAKQRAMNDRSTESERSSMTPDPHADHREISHATPRNRAQRDEQALRVDNVAFSRPAPLPALGTASTPAIAAPTRPFAVTSGQPVGEPSATPAHHAFEPAADGPRYRLLEGTVIETVLTNRLDGSFVGPVNCLVTTPVYAAGAQPLLIPAGARALGEAKPVNTFGQSRLAVVYHRLILPNGTSVDLHDFHGLNQVGDQGIRDLVNRHYTQIFGVSLAVGAIAGLAQAQTAVGLDATAFDVYRQGAAANVAQSSARILDRFLNILPTVTIREGHRIKVYLANDLELPAYRDARPTPGGRP